MADRVMIFETVGIQMLIISTVRTNKLRNYQKLSKPLRKKFIILTAKKKKYNFK